MKPLLTLSLVLLLSTTAFAANPLSVGDKIPDLELILIGEEQPTSVAAFQGKVVIIEFWATWCSPCIQSMQHLKDLKERFGTDLVILAVSHERPERIASFMGNTNFPFTYARESDLLREYFPYRVIPHTVVLSPEQKIAAITEPNALTEDGLAELLQGKSVDLPLKEDQAWNMEIDIFDLDTLAKQSFQIQPARPEAPTYSRTYNNGPFKNRRHSFVNFQIPMLYRQAYDISSYRMESPEIEKPETYCVDILVPESESSQLEAIFRDSISAYFGWKVSWEAREMEVWVISALPTGIRLLPAEAAAPHAAAGDHFTSKGATPTDFASYLESYGIAGMPVVNETGSEQLYAFDFSFEPENPESFFQALTAMGLTVKKEKRMINRLRLAAPE